MSAAARRERRAPGARVRRVTAAAIVAVAASVTGCRGLCSGETAPLVVRAPGRAPDLAGTLPGRAVRIEMPQGAHASGRVRFVSITSRVSFLGGPLDDGGSFWIGRAGDRAEGLIRPRGRAAVFFAPEPGGMGPPSPMPRDDGGFCGTPPPHWNPLKWVPHSKGSYVPPPVPPPAVPPGQVVDLSVLRRGTFVTGGGSGGGSDGGATIRVGFMFAPAAAAALCPGGDLTLADPGITAALAEASACMVGSGISATYEFAGTTTYPYDASGRSAESVTTIATDVQSTELGTGTSAGRAALDAFRDEVQADVVAVVVGTGAPVRGWAPVIADWGTASPASLDARAWTVQRCDTLGTETFSHEIAHVLGCGHQRGLDEPVVATQDCWSHGWVYWDDGDLRATRECQVWGVPYIEEAGLEEYVCAYSSAATVHWSAPMGEAHDGVCTGQTTLCSWASPTSGTMGADSTTTITFTAPLLANVR